MLNWSNAIIGAALGVVASAGLLLLINGTVGPVGSVQRELEPVRLFCRLILTFWFSLGLMFLIERVRAWRDPAYARRLASAKLQRRGRRQQQIVQFICKHFHLGLQMMIPADQIEHEMRQLIARGLQHHLVAQGTLDASAEGAIRGVITLLESHEPLDFGAAPTLEPVDRMWHRAFNEAQAERLLALEKLEVLQATHRELCTHLMYLFQRLQFSVHITDTDGIIRLLALERSSLDPWLKEVTCATHQQLPPPPTV